MDKSQHRIWIRFLLNLSRFIDSRVSDTGDHSDRVAYLARHTARKLKMNEDEVQAIYWAALVHDIGKIGVPTYVLSKAGPLTEHEWVVMKLHPTVGTNIIKSLKALAHTAPIIYAHQEKYDGTGYPEGKSGEEIPFGARILAVVDAYDAMTNDRAYRPARSHCEAAEELISLSGAHFDPKVVEAFLKVVETHSLAARNGRRIIHIGNNGHRHKLPKRS